MSFNFPRILLGAAAVGSVVLAAYWVWVYVTPYFV